MKIAEMGSTTREFSPKRVAGAIGGAMDNGEYDYGKRAQDDPRPVHSASGSTRNEDFLVSRRLCELTVFRHTVST
jgi:hypothetical protein